MSFVSDLLGTGLVVGLTGALVTTGLLRGLLFGVAPHDPVTLGVVTAMICVVLPSSAACSSQLQRG